MLISDLKLFTSDLTLPKWWGKGSMDSRIWMEALLSSVGFTYDLNLDNSLLAQNKHALKIECVDIFWIRFLRNQKALLTDPVGWSPVQIWSKEPQHWSLWDRSRTEPKSWGWCWLKPACKWSPISEDPGWGPCRTWQNHQIQNRG